MSASKRPSTSSLRRFITSRPYVTVAELRRRFGLDDPDAMAHLQRNGTSAWIGLPEREAIKLADLWHRDELGLELSVEVRAPVVVGIYPMRIARFVTESLGANGATNGHAVGNGHAPHHQAPPPSADSNGSPVVGDGANGNGGFTNGTPAADRHPRRPYPHPRHSTSTHHRAE